jgi:protein ImuB
VPIAIVQRASKGQVVVACCESARRHGLREGMTLSHARSLLGGQPHHVENLQPAMDLQSLDALAQWALRFGPLVQVDPFSQFSQFSQKARPGEGGLLMDITGCQRFFGGEANLLAGALRSLRGLGVHARIASAATIGCAWALARYGPQQTQLVDDGCEVQALAALPTAALRLDEATIAALAEVGLRQIGQVLPLPRAALAQRFGPLLLRRIDQAMGLVWEAVEPVSPVTVPQVALELAGPVRDISAVLLGVRHLLGRLLVQLGPHNLGVRRLKLVAKRSDAPPLESTLSLAYANADEKHLWTLLRPEVEQINLGFGVEGLYLFAAETGKLEQTQMALLPEALEAAERAARPSSRLDAQASRRMNRKLGELVDVLTSRLGSGGVLCAQAVDSHVPERAFVLQSAREGLSTDTEKGLSTSARRRGLGRVTGPRFSGAHDIPPRGDRPSVLLDRPEPIEIIALTPDGPVVSFTHKGRCHAVQTCLGPERIAPQWWAMSHGQGGPDGRATRDYFKLQDQHGCWYWIYRELNNNRWFIHGLWE